MKLAKGKITPEELDKLIRRPETSSTKIIPIRKSIIPSNNKKKEYQK